MFGVMFDINFVDESSSTTPRTARGSHQLIFANFLTAKYYVIPHAFLQTVNHSCAQAVFELAYEYW